MKVIVGLGNPGSEYSDTRHNVGFMTIDALAQRLNVNNWRSKFSALVAETKVGDEKVILVKPQTYMNLSGNSVGEIMRWYKVNSTDIIAIYDDMDFPVGSAKLRKNGSSGGHRGVESLLVNIGKEDFARVRIGIGRPAPNWTVVDHVLAKFSLDDQKEIDEIVKKVLPAIECIATQGIEKAMSRYNFKNKKITQNQKIMTEEAKA